VPGLRARPTLRHVDVAFRVVERVGLRDESYFEALHTACTLAVYFAGAIARAPRKTRFRLAALPWPVGTFTRGLLREVSASTSLPPHPGFSWRTYNEDRPHMGLDGDAPVTRAVEPGELGKVLALPRVGGLHHRYVRRAA
jgi:hypothetical protein